MTENGSGKDRSAAQALLSRLPLAFAHPLQGYAIALVAVGLALAIRFALDAVLPSGFPFLTFFPTILLVCFVLGLGPAIFSAGLGLGLGWYFFLGPAHSFWLTTGTFTALGLYVIIVALVVSLIHGLQTANRHLARERAVSRELAEHREVLFLELQHRVGNNLQMIGSVLSLQKRNLTEPAARAAIDDAARRVGLIGRVQRSLYLPDGQPIALDTYLARIVADIVDTSGRNDIATTVTVDRVSAIRPALAIPVALIMAEAVSNAIEHGLAARGGTIRVEARGDGEGMSIAVHDDGAGLPDGFRLEGISSLGMRLCTSLARHHGGSFALSCADGWTSARLFLPLPE